MEQQTTLDKTRGYAVVYGDSVIRFEQDGQSFDRAGKLVVTESDAPPEKSVATPPEEPAQESPKNAHQRPPPRSVQLALSVLKSLAAGNAEAVTVETWQAAFVQDYLSCFSGSAETAKRTFRSAKKALCASGELVVADGIAHLSDCAGNGAKDDHASADV